MSYKKLDEIQRDHFLEQLSKFDLNIDYRNIINLIRNQKNGIRFLIRLREDLLKQKKKNENLMLLEKNLTSFFHVLFSPKYLKLKRLTIKSPKIILKKILKYERVHEMKNLKELNNRLGLSKRLFAYFHLSMPYLPLVFIKVALTTKISKSLQEILNYKGNILDEKIANTAIFYSISMTQLGLNGLDLGNLLIKNVVKILQKNPNINTFSTLSPIPGFLNWLNDSIEKKEIDLSNEEEKILKSIHENEEDSMIILKNLININEINDKIESIMMKLCANYLFIQKKKNGFILDPVGNFHIRNGAIMYRINWKGNNSENGIKSSYGILVNYKYDLESIEVNSKSYKNNKRVQVGKEFKNILCRDDII
eukprot:gene11402-4569_t